MKWQLIRKWDETDKIKMSWLKYFGATLHSRPEIACDEWRLSFFALSKPYADGIVGGVIKIYIPFMRKDHGLILY